MKTGNFYFLNDQYFIDFPDPQLARNKETINGQVHDRPCFFSFTDGDSKICWMIPFSSNTAKYRRIYNHKICKRGICDTLYFGDVLGYQKAFLIQNMCPVTDEYVKNEYKDSNATPVRVDGVLEQKLVHLGKKVLALVRRGNKPLIFPDVLKIEAELLDKINMKDEEPEMRDTPPCQ
jgi:hypothetical protein